MSDDMKHLMEMCLDDHAEKINEFIDKKSNEQLLVFLESILDDNPFIYLDALPIIITRLYSDNDRFIELLCKLIDNTSSDCTFSEIIEPIYRIAVEQSQMTVSIAEKMIKRGIRPGLCSGIIVAPLLGKGIVDKEIVANLKSGDSSLQCRSLVALCSLFIKKDEEISKSLAHELLRVSKKIDQDNTDILIQCLVRAFHIGNSSVANILEEEIERRGYIAAVTYVRTTRYRKEFPISLLKKATSIIEAKTPEDGIIDDALAMIYEKDQVLVVEKLRERLREGSDISLARSMLRHHIKRIDPSPVIRMLEEEIDSGNAKMLSVGESLLHDFLRSATEWVEWCNKWKGDVRKEKIVLRSLGRIVTDLMNYEPSSIRDKAIVLIKEFAKHKHIDYEKETEQINLGADSHEGAMNKEAAIKALRVLGQILYPRAPINIDILKMNLKNYPNLCKAIGEKWLVRSAKSESPHILAYIYSRKIDYKKMGNLAKEYETERNKKKKFAIAWRHDALAHAARTQSYWEHVFRILAEHGLNIPQRKLQDSRNSESILAELEVVSKLAPHFKVILEPEVKKLGAKRLDAMIELNDQQALIEIAVVKKRIEVEVAHGAICFPSGKVKSVLLSKFKNQLQEGKIDPRIPVIILLCLDDVLDSHDVEDAIYGQSQLQFKVRPDTQHTVEEGTTRKDNSFYEEKNSDIVTAIAAYKRDYLRKDSLVGKLYRPYPIVPKNAIDRNFRLVLRNALFGESENSHWQSLRKVEGIDERIARELHNHGIEDLGTLALATEDDLNVERLDKGRLKIFQGEAKRIISALATGSIRFLKGIDECTYDMLTRSGVHLINQVIELTDTPKGVDPLIWETILEDARRITTEYNQKE